jgi:hypothetical protein
MAKKATQAKTARPKPTPPPPKSPPVETTPPPVETNLPPVEPTLPPVETNLPPVEPTLPSTEANLPPPVVLDALASKAKGRRRADVNANATVTWDDNTTERMFVPPSYAKGVNAAEYAKAHVANLRGRFAVLVQFD